MATKQHLRKSSKGRKGHKFCFSWWTCCGVSNRISADHRADTKIVVKSDGPTFPTETAISTSKEIHVVVEAEERKTQILAIPISYKKRDMTCENNSKEMTKSSQVLNSTNKTIDGRNTLVQKGGSKLTSKTSRSVPLTQPQTVNDQGGELDPLVGAVIVTVTLIVMSICGKVCAILWMAIWLYFIPRLRARAKDSKLYTAKISQKDGRDRIDVESREYKKRIVLEGLLQRDQN